MKSTSKMMVVAAVFLVAAAMLVMPATARENVPGVAAGQTVFLYEENLNLSALTPAGAENFTLVHFTNDDTDSGVAVDIDVNDPKDVDLMEAIASKVGSNTGRYFVNDKAGQYIYIKKPAVQLKPVLADSHSDSIDGKTVSSSAQIAFQLIAPDVG
ncbi:DUF3821 domain-containing protein, partial [uncultured Methanofollis sp.]|uniref:DUF3821 domain-containing protein n=1 Tax=uncultured Methanofollis sp. TaxID=262500 RepID=UPI00260D896C